MMNDLYDNDIDKWDNNIQQIMWCKKYENEEKLLKNNREIIYYLKMKLNNAEEASRLNPCLKVIIIYELYDFG